MTDIKAFPPNRHRPWWLVWNPYSDDWLTADTLRAALYQIPAVEDDRLFICGAGTNESKIEVPLNEFLAYLHIPARVTT